MLQHQNIVFVLSFWSLFMTILCHCSATQFIVGDSAGWVIPPYPTYYGNWSQSHFIRAGDSLEFNLDTKFYNLIQVSQSEYEHCTSLEPLKVFNSSPVIFPLKKRGVYYFTCSVANYCFLGQKIAISVHKENPPTPSPSPSPSPMISPQLSPNGTSAPTPTHSGMSNPPESSATNITTMPPGSNGGPPGHSSTQGLGEKSNAVAVALVCAMLGTFLGFWVM